jgi:hypothetical protein
VPRKWRVVIGGTILGVVVIVCILLLLRIGDEYYQNQKTQTQKWFEKQELVVYKIKPTDDWEDFFYNAPEELFYDEVLKDVLQEQNVKQGYSAWDEGGSLVVGDQMLVPESFVKMRLSE